jgi:peptidoglycan/LPS O-acetylase OafA/YrhL
VVRNSLDTLSGLAIIFIVIYHSLGGYRFLGGEVFFSDFHYFLLAYAGFIGLALFSFVAGYKFIYNHNKNIGSRAFLRSYALRRIRRLYGPYVLYTLAVIPIYATLIVLGNHFRLDYTAMHVFDAGTKALIISFLTGPNLLAPHLWYLVSLLLITLVCIGLLYVSDMRAIYIVGLISAILAVLGISPALDSIFTYGSIFILGMGAARTKKEIPLIRSRILSALGRDSFWIYLLHLPFIEPALSRSLPLGCVTPFVITALTICIIVSLKRGGERILLFLCSRY